MGRARRQKGEGGPGEAGSGRAGLEGPGKAGFSTQRGSPDGARHCLSRLTPKASFLSPSHRLRTLRRRKMAWAAQGHPAGRWSSRTGSLGGWAGGHRRTHGQPPLLARVPARAPTPLRAGAAQVPQPRAQLRGGPGRSGAGRAPCHLHPRRGGRSARTPPLAAPQRRVALATARLPVEMLTHTPTERQAQAAGPGCLHRWAGGRGPSDPPGSAPPTPAQVHSQGRKRGDAPRLLAWVGAGTLPTPPAPRPPA